MTDEWECYSHCSVSKNLFNEDDNADSVDLIVRFSSGKTIAANHDGKMLIQNMKKDSIIVYESTVYPGVTEEVCIPILENISRLKCKQDFKIGYSPERINPGDKIRTIDNIIKIVSGIDDETLMEIYYEAINEASLSVE